MSASDEVYVAARRLILDCAYLPGDVVTEAALAARLGAGLTPARNALARLKFDRLVSAVPRVGYVVNDVGTADIDEVFQIWSFAGPAIVSLALHRMTRADRATLEAYAEELQRANDPAVWQARTTDIFDLYRRCADNRQLDGFLGPLENELRRVLTLTLRDSAAARLLTALRYANPGARDEHFVDDVRGWSAKARIICVDAIGRLPPRPLAGGLHPDAPLETTD